MEATETTKEINIKEITNKNLTNTLAGLILHVLISFCIIFLIFFLITKSIHFSCTFATFLPCLFTLINLLFANKILLKISNATLPQENISVRINNIMKSIITIYNIKQPKILIIPSTNINSISIGLFKNHSYICLTEGAVNSLTDIELKYLLTYHVFQIYTHQTSFYSTLISTLGILTILSDLFFIYVDNAKIRRGKESESLMRLLLTLLFNGIVPPILKLIYATIPLDIELTNDYIASQNIPFSQVYTEALIKALSKNAYYKSHLRSSASMYWINPYSNKFKQTTYHHLKMEERLTLKGTKEPR